jgi:hypothetical protein
MAAIRMPWLNDTRALVDDATNFRRPAGAMGMLGGSAAKINR